MSVICDWNFLLTSVDDSTPYMIFGASNSIIQLALTDVSYEYETAMHYTDSTVEGEF